jgi:hypothetical protein
LTQDGGIEAVATIIATDSITLDGVLHAPGSADETAE